MCGILGVVKKNNEIDSFAFKLLNRSLRHRGPDAEGFWFGNKNRIALGHNRLSIIDLKKGQQPMISLNKDLIITFNGEIYNYKILKEELIKKKYKFLSDSDTEVVLNSYREWGVDCVKKFRGMFAFGLVDKRKKEIFLARDYFGIKPLVYYHDQDIFCFCSELGLISKIANIDLEIDYSAIDLYLRFQYIPAPKTIYKKVKKLEPAHFLRLDFFGNILQKEKYWQPEFKTNKSKTEDEWLAEFEEVIKESVKMHMISDVPVGAFLSGGIDSTLITKYMSQFNKNVNTFGIAFKEKDYNESTYSERVATKYSTKHNSKIINSDFFSILKKLVSYYGEPFGDSSAIPTFYVSKLAREKVKVVLSGDGGDELFGGYNSYIAWIEKATKKEKSSIIYNFARLFLSLVKPNRYSTLEPTFKNWLNLVEYFSFYERKSLYKQDFQVFLSNKYSFFDNYKKTFKKNTIVQKAQLFDILNYLPFDILTKVDIASMANGLEVRVPFLDKKVAEFALKVPEKINSRNYNWEGKVLLKKILEKDFPPSFVYRKKQGFAIPIVKWFGENGALYAEPYKKLIDSDSKIFKNIFNIDAVYASISCGEYSKIYFLLFLEEWLLQNENRKNLIKL